MREPADTLEALATLSSLTTPRQYDPIAAALRADERSHFADDVVHIHESWHALPRTLASEAHGRAAVVQLHYFRGDADWWVTGRDIDPDNPGRVWAFGLADFGSGPEPLGFSIREIIDCGAELDLYWQPKTVAEVTGRCLA